MDNILLIGTREDSIGTKEIVHFTNSTLKFEVPPYSNISCARCSDQLLEGDRKLHFDLSSEIWKGLQRVTQSVSFGRNSFRFMYTVGTFAKERVFRRGQSGPLSREELQSGMSSQNGSFSFGSPEKVVGLQAQTFIAFLYSLQKYCSPITLQNKQIRKTGIR